MGGGGGGGGGGECWPEAPALSTVGVVVGVETGEVAAGVGLGEVDVVAAGVAVIVGLGVATGVAVATGVVVGTGTVATGDAAYGVAAGMEGDGVAIGVEVGSAVGVGGRGSGEVETPLS